MIINHWAKRGAQHFQTHPSTNIIYHDLMNRSIFQHRSQHPSLVSVIQVQV